MNVLFQHVIVSAFIQYWADPAGRPVWGVGSNPAGGINVSCKSCVLLDRGFCIGPITHPGESYWV